MLSNLIENLDIITNEIETKLIASNIKDGVEIFGIEGSVEPIITQHKHLSPMIYTQIAIPDTDYNGLHEVIVDAVTAAIDKNIQANNIRYNKRILGIMGTLSKLTEDEYNEALLMTIDILGTTIYVLKSSLVLDTEDYSVEENGTLSAVGTVEGKTLKIN